MKKFLSSIDDHFHKLTASFTGDPELDLVKLDENFKLITDNSESTEYLKEILLNNLTNTIENGMNTFGILMDRLTILVCKKYLSVDNNDKLSAEKQIEKVATMLLQCGSGDPTLLKKEQVSVSMLRFENLGNALVSLLRANIGMWVNQDLLYTKNINDISDSRLRNYIIFFSRENSLRNQSISYLDIQFNERK